jgi:hypothetical protein
VLNLDGPIEWTGCGDLQNTASLTLDQSSPPTCIHTDADRHRHRHGQSHGHGHGHGQKDKRELESALTEEEEEEI